MENIKTIIFDYDGTLYNSAKNYGDAFRHIYSQMVEDGDAPERSFTDKEINQWLGYSAQDMWEAFMPELSKRKQFYYSKEIGRFISDRVQRGEAELYDGALDTLQYLKNRGYNLLYLSNCGPDYMNTHAECFDLRNYFNHMYCTGDYEFKPKYEIFNVIKEEYPPEYLMVGDRFHDMEVARYHKAFTAGCAYGFGSPKELEGADVILKDISDLQKLL